MPSREQIAMIKQTVPVLQEYGEQLARHMYARMFEHNPEVRRYFNPAHQRSGKQQKALSAAVCAYAANIDNPALLGGAVELIAQKHASLAIAPEHYPIVGEHLLASIREVLGDAAPPMTSSTPGPPRTANLPTCSSNANARSMPSRRIVTAGPASSLSW